MVAIPFGLIGVVGAFALHGESLGFMAIMGVTGMMGVVVNDSLILVNFINMHRREDREKKFMRIVAEGTASRFRPILMTSITTVCGLIPTAYGFGGADPFIASMALALGYGILFATPLTLLLLPCLYMPCCLCYQKQSSLPVSIVVILIWQKSFCPRLSEERWQRLP